MAFKSSYSALDRAVHRLAFRSYAAQVTLAEIENRIFAEDNAKILPDRPVFIAGLPRAGTTLLLECFARSESFASHQYSDMPFVLIPRVWNCLSQRHRPLRHSQQRAHGDGMTINIDSPEALEEVLWGVFWKSHYLEDRILPWDGSIDAEFHAFLVRHMRKIMHLRSVKARPQARVRYLSKNNPNTARIALLRQMFPQGEIVIPFRNPVQHAASLLRQHENFLALQAEDPFILEYMSAVGHWDFGQRVRPLDFDGWLDQGGERDAETMQFWLMYWVACYRHVLNQRKHGIHLLSFERFCENAVSQLQQLAEVLQIADSDSLVQSAGTVRGSTSHTPDVSKVSHSVLSEANRLHEELLALAV